MPDLNWTTPQRQAIQCVGGSVVVSAAAGSGKTAVLAERCAYLVCDAPPEHRCSLDRLLVLTFTEAAAAEMKNRIREGFRKRLRDHPDDRHLRQQAALLECAHISTIHAFCNRLIRRWFNRIEIDPASTLLPEDEAGLLRAATLDELVADLYDSADPPAERFRSLVDVYGLGNDASIKGFILKLAGHLDSLPDPDGWLADAHRRLTGGPDRLRRYVLRPLCHELNIMRDAPEQFAHFANSSHRCIAYYGQLFADHAEKLRTWQHALDQLCASDSDIDSLTAEFEAIRLQLADHKPSFNRRAPSIPKDATQAELDTINALRSVRDDITKTYQTRVREPFALFTADETLQCLDAVAPFAAALTELATAFRDRYRDAKRRLDVLDFADLEALAYQLLSDDDVANAVRGGFEYVLVDEYQDISPIQDALLRRVSREDTADALPNLFAVGDVKQSIYGFRAAEPDVFRRRLERCQQDPDRNTAVLLHENFRSRSQILEAINLLFAQLMRRTVGGIDYDESHLLQPGRADADGGSKCTVELHLLERKATPTQPGNDDEHDDQTPGPRFVDPDDPAEWQTIEREAYVIAAEIRRILASGMTVEDGRPVTFADVAVLLRSAAHTADALAGFLIRLGIDAEACTGRPADDPTEIRDLRALLEVLDNTQQDIPLAALLRSRVLDHPLTEDQLFAIRSIDRDVPFHQAVHRYVENDGPERDPDLQERVKTILRRISAYRDAMRQMPIADALWQIIHDTGYLAYIGGLPGGGRRRRNVLSFHERARQFGTFKNQGLRRFLDFLDALERDDRTVTTAPPATRTANAVRIMTIHSSKGLEFPVVFIADLGRKFNLRDTHGRLIFQRHQGIGLRVIDTQRMIEYPSAAHHLVTAATRRQTRAEELRLLYVAMTRAQEKLILVGSTRLESLQSRRTLWTDHRPTITPLEIESASDPLAWLIPAPAGLPDTDVVWSDRPPQPAPPGRDKTPHPPPRFQVHLHTTDTIASWNIAPQAPGETPPLLHAVARLRDLPPDEPTSADPTPAESVLERIKFDYPHLSFAAIRAVVAASEVKSTHDSLRDDEQRPITTDEWNPLPPPHVTPPPHPQPAPLGRDHAIRDSAIRDDPAQDSADRAYAQRRGTVTHRLLQHIDFQTGGRPGGIQLECQRLIDAGLLTPAEVELVDADAITWFCQSPIGRAAHQAAADYHREFMFIAAHPAHWFDPTLPHDLDERVLVRGVVDGVINSHSDLEIIDFKTDLITPDQADHRAERYRNQMNLYTASVEPIFRKPVKQCWLVFLHPRVIVTEFVSRQFSVTDNSLLTTDD